MVGITMSSSSFSGGAGAIEAAEVSAIATTMLLRSLFQKEKQRERE